VYLGGLACGAWKSREALDAGAPKPKAFWPLIGKDERDRRIMGWRDALSLAARGKIS
jgi:hypothetical protein